MLTRACAVSFIGTSGIRHGVEVEAESLYEAAVKLKQSVFGVAALGWFTAEKRGQADVVKTVLAIGLIILILVVLLRFGVRALRTLVVHLWPHQVSSPWLKSWASSRQIQQGRFT